MVQLFNDSRSFLLFLFPLLLLLVVLRADEKKCIKWGNTFDVSLEQTNVRLDCNVPGSTAPRTAVCCAAVSQDSDLSYNGIVNRKKGVGKNFEPPFNSNNIKNQRRFSATANCEISREYFPSPYETYHLNLAKEIDAISTFEGRLETLLNHITSPAAVVNATKWLDRIAIHMTNENVPLETKDDTDFLSRFRVRRVCGGTIGIGGSEDNIVTEWDEWIEPLTITARHPFGFGRCRNAQTHFVKNIPRTNRANSDYVLLQSGQALHNSSYTQTANGKIVRIRNTHSSHSPLPPMHYLLDAGTSTFDSSLFWFTCGYSQRRIGFDQVYAWEMTLLEPTDYWSRVPAKWKPFWHFFNVPISSNATHPDSPVRLIKSLASPSDFVSFKLDIDHPDTEMPIALSLLSDPSFASLVDEFFFELHFQCEVMTSCGWGKRVPAEANGLKLDRSHVLAFFQEVRFKGVRAHIWP